MPLHAFFLLKMLLLWAFPGGPVAKTPNAEGPGSILVRELDPTCRN